jgi:adenosylcobinamide kinase/adenosylcobinamide-phosphate guanylyltransferase
VSPPRLVLVGGGARSGKSSFALARARELGARRLFIATAEPSDDEMRDRIARHRSDRGDDFRTVEEPLALPERLAALEVGDSDVVLVDCLTLWLSNLLVRGAADGEAVAAVDRLLEAAARCPAPIVMVTNEVGMGLVPETPLGRRFRDLAGLAHQRLAARADEIYVAILGLMLRVRPGPVSMI